MNYQACEQQNILRFSLGGRGQFGINVLKIKEIVPYKQLNCLPGSKPGIAGLIELRGHSIQVIDLSQIIGLPPLKIGEQHQASIIVTEFNRTMQGLLVKQVDKIASIDWREVKALPKATGAGHYLSGVINIENELIGVVDVEKVLYELEPQQDMATAPYDGESIANIKDKKILAVDDSQLARHMIAKTLDLVDANYIMASSGREALDIISDHDTAFDMIISDIEMPQMDGYALTRKLRQNESLKDCYILLHSSLSGNACEYMSKEVGANALLTKFATDELIGVIRTALS